MTELTLKDYPVKLGDIDPDCVHCVFSAPLQAFTDAHPLKDPVQTFGEILQLAADYCASCVPEDTHAEALVTAPKLLEGLMRDSFAGAAGFQRRRQ